MPPLSLLVSRKLLHLVPSKTKGSGRCFMGVDVMLPMQGHDLVGEDWASDGRDQALEGRDGPPALVSPIFDVRVWAPDSNAPVHPHFKEHLARV